MTLQTLPTPGDSSWYVRDRFGLFIHWGLYSLPARHEWVQHTERIAAADYERYAELFDPDRYDPEAWADAAADAGMKYFVITTKHHEGFCLWDSAFTDFKATNSPAKRDLLRPMVEAFRKRGIRVGLYYSLIDWRHPHFVIDDQHALRDNPQREEMNKGRDQQQYIEYLHNQVRELLTEYGKIDLMFFDFSYPSRWGWKNYKGEPFVGKDYTAWDSQRLVKMCRELQPGILLNDRLDVHEGPGEMEGGFDIRTPEQFAPREWVRHKGHPAVWEACHTFSGSWGYHRDEHSWKSTPMLLRLLVDTVSKGGNLLLNVGPTSRGEFDARALDRLGGMGEWMRKHGRAIYGCTQAPPEFKPPQDCRLTYDAATRRLYVHVFAWPFKHLHLDGSAYLDHVAYAQLLSDGSELKLKRPEKQQAEHANLIAETQGSLTVELPVAEPEPHVAVIELVLK